MARGGKAVFLAATAALGGCASSDGLKIRPVADAITASKSGDELAVARGQFALGNIGLALEGFRKAQRDHPTDSAPLSGIADCYSRMGRFDVAQSSLEAALALDPHNSELLVRLAAVYAAEGQQDQAANALRDAKAAALAEAAPVAAQPAPTTASVTVKLPDPMPVAVATVAQQSRPGQSVTVKLPDAGPEAAPRQVAEAPAPVAVAAAAPVAVAAVAPAPSTEDRLQSVEAAVRSAPLPKQPVEIAADSIAPPPAQPVQLAMATIQPLASEPDPAAPAPVLADSSAAPVPELEAAARSVVSPAAPADSKPAVEATVSPAAFAAPAPAAPPPAPAQSRTEEPAPAAPAPHDLFDLVTPQPAGEAEPAKAIADAAPSAPPAAPAEPKPAPEYQDALPTRDSPRLVRMSAGEVALVTTGEPLLKGRSADKSVAVAQVQWVPLSNPGQQGNVQVLNAARSQGLAASARSVLADRGWRKIGIGDAPAVRQVSVVYYAHGHERLARRLARQFGVKARLGDVTRVVLVLGRDMVGPVRALRDS